MKIVVIGGGLLGVTTAYYLASGGHQVIAIDRNDGPGKGASFANGGLLTPSMADPWNSPGSWRVLLTSLARPQSAMKLRMRALPSLLTWGVRFLRNSSPAVFERNTRNNLRLAQYSLAVMRTIRDETGVEYGRAALGSLRVFRNTGALDSAIRTAGKWSSEGLVARELTVLEVLTLEPALEPIADDLAGAIHYQDDEVGDAYRFCIGMRDAAARKGVSFRFGVDATSLIVHSRRIAGVMTNRGRLDADAFVIAGGSYSARLARTARVNLPVRPVKGYSVTFAAPMVGTPLRIPIVDDQLHSVVTPLGGNVRVAGTAEFTGYDLTVRRDRIANLIELLRTLLPSSSFDMATAKPWCGLRPMSADGVPIVGETSVSNLFVNTGHGHLGWTMAVGSARLLADVIGKKSSPIEPGSYALRRFNSR
jgi:D-amino-acid dehydrogenase